MTDPRGVLLELRPFMSFRSLLFALVALCEVGVRALDSSCYSYRLGGDVIEDEVPACTASADDVRGIDRCTLLCAVCTTPATRFAMNFNGIGQGSSGFICDDPAYAYDPDEALDVATAALSASAAAHGYYWLDGGSESNATQAVRFLLGNMPLRDIELLFGGQYFETLDWLFEHVRLALLTRSSWGAAKAVPWETFLEHVLPYAALDEKRDVSWRWRSRFFELFFANASAHDSLYEAAVSIAGLIPSTSSLGVYMVDDGFVAGNPFQWKSSTAPAYLSPQQATLGASCTGTALVLLAAYRSVGIPARIAGCSNEYKNGAWVDDDHHWVEFWDSQTTGPFSPSGGDDDDEAEMWHTKEGTSKGNAGGPWDSPSSSMNGCLAKMVPGDNMATLWASSWSSSTFFPTMWHNNSWAKSTGFVGGLNVCGRYCSAWGCGNGTSMDQVNYYTQQACAPSS